MNSAISVTMKNYHNYFLVHIKGDSMYPVINNGELILCEKKESYRVGDIVVFVYEKSHILIHRILKIQRQFYFCKGDNSFRIEYTNIDDILGCAIVDDDYNKNDSFIKASLNIGRLFKKCKYDKDLIIQCRDYINYKNKYLTEHRVL